MNKALKIFGFTILGIVVATYLAFLLILPNAINLNDYKPDVQKILKEQANLSINFENLKIITTPLLAIGVKADNISVKLPDNSNIFTADKIKTRISLPSLLLLTVKVSCLEVEKPFVNLEIINDENFKIVKLVENLLNEGKEQKFEEEKQIEQTKEEQGFQFNPEWIRVKVPCIKLKDYTVLVNDLKSKHYLKLHGDELKLGYFNGKSAKIKTYAELFSDENKNITAKIDINTFLPKFEPALDEEDDPAQRIEIPFVNPVTMYRNYDLKANLDTKLFVRDFQDGINSFGHLYIDNVTLKVSHLTLPESYLRANTCRKNIDIDTDIFVTKDQNLTAMGKIQYGKSLKTDLLINTKSIKFNDMLILTKAFLDSLHIRNELNQIKAEGYLTADCFIKTDFKKLLSSGYITVKNGGLNVRGSKIISNANINVLLDDNCLNINNSSLNIANAPISVKGSIDKDSVADININAQKIPVPVLFYAFAPKEIRNAYNFKSCFATFGFSLKGKMKDAMASLRFNIDNFNFSDKQNSFILNNKLLLGEFALNTKNILGKINNTDFTVTMPSTKSKISIPKTNIEIAEKNITLNDGNIIVNNKSKMTYKGNIIDYTKLNSINFDLKGSANTDDIIKLIGNELKMYIHSKGVIPVSLTLNGNGKKQTLILQALADANNFITPVDFNNLIGKETALQSIINFKGNRIKIKQTGLFTRNTTVDEEGKETVNLEEIFGMEGTIAGDRINLLKIKIPNVLAGKLHVFPDSNFNVEGQAFVFGQLEAPRIRGGFSLNNLSIPELLLTMQKADLIFKGHNADINVNNLILNGSDLQFNAVLSLIPSPILNISNLNVSSKYLNADKLLKVSDLAMKYVPQTPASSAKTSSASVNSAANGSSIPVVIRTGTINMARIISGNISINNVISRISMADDIFYLRNLRARIFDGHVHGNISMNLITSFMDIKMRGTGLNVDKALNDAAAMKDTLSGIAQFNADISLKGSTYEEQMKSLKGNVDFTITEGQFGPFGKIENMILAENIRESQFFQTALGGVINSLLTIDTTHFSELKGEITFKDGICHIEPLTSLGNILSLHIFGDFDLLKNEADMKVRARMASLISNLLGPIGAINPVNLVNSAASMNIITAKAFSLFCEMVPEDEISILPSFSNNYVDNSAMKFQIVVRGDVAKPLKLVKSFKWLTTSGEYQNAQDFINSIPDAIEGSQATTIEQLIAERKAFEEEQKTIKYKVKHIFDDKNKQ